MFRAVLNILVFVLLLAFVAVTLAFSTSRLSKVNCSELNVMIDKGSPRFIGEEEIKRLILKADGKLFEKNMDEINTEQLEIALKKVAAIKNIEIFRRITGTDMDFKGKLSVRVTQRDPVFRIMTEQEDFYMDREGVRIPASSQFTAKVLLANGQMDEKYAREQLLPLVIFIDENEFWKAQIEQLQVKPNGEIWMAPLVGDQLIEFGDAANYRQKFQNLKALYEQAFPKTGWDYYSKINVKYTNQVVCTKK